MQLSACRSLYCNSFHLAVTFTGTYDRGSGAFSVKFKGTLVK